MKAQSSMLHRAPGKEMCTYKEMNDERPCGTFITKYEYSMTKTPLGQRMVHRTGTCARGHVTLRTHGPDVKDRASRSYDIVPAKEGKEE